MGINRRRVLAALAAAGGAGALTGTGTAAFLGDAERGSVGLTTGLLDVAVEVWQDTDDVDQNDPDRVIDGPWMNLLLDALDDEQSSGSVLLRFVRPESETGTNNPARLWLRTECPDGTTLAEFLEVTLSYADADGTPVETLTDADGTPLADRSLRELADALRSGYLLDGNGDTSDGDDDCLTDDLWLLIEYDASGYVGAESASLPVFVGAVQCRNTDPTTNPFPESDVVDACEPSYVCDCCWAIGKVEVESTLQAGSTYAFDEGLTGYELSVTEVDGDTGVAFDLVAADDRPVFPICEVQVKGGPDDERYVRRSDEFGFDSTVLDGATDGLVYAPENPNNGNRYGISYVLVKVCAPRTADGTCPEDVAEAAASVGPGGPVNRGPPNRPGNGGKP
jgi:hypothetical protein